MPMQGKLITSVLVPAQTQPQKKNLSNEDAQIGAFILLGFVLVFGVIIALSRNLHAVKNQRAVQRQLANPDSGATDYVKAQAN